MPDGSNVCESTTIMKLLDKSAQQQEFESIEYIIFDEVQNYASVTVQEVQPQAHSGETSESITNRAGSEKSHQSGAPGQFDNDAQCTM